MTSCFHFCSAPICVSICPNDSKGWCSLKFLSNNGNCAFYTSLSLSLTHTHKQVKATSSIHLPLSFIYTHPHPLSLSHPQTHLSGKSEPKRALHNPSATYRPKLKRVRERERERERERGDVSEIGRRSDLTSKEFRIDAALRESELSKVKVWTKIVHRWRRHSPSHRHRHRHHWLWH